MANNFHPKNPDRKISEIRSVRHNSKTSKNQAKSFVKRKTNSIRNKTILTLIVLFSLLSLLVSSIWLLNSDSPNNIIKDLVNLNPDKSADANGITISNVSPLQVSWTIMRSFCYHFKSVGNYLNTFLHIYCP